MSGGGGGLILPFTPKPCMVMSPPDRTWPNYIAGWLAAVTPKIHLSQAVEEPPAPLPHTSVRHGSALVCLERGVSMCLCEVQSVCISVYQVGPCLPWDGRGALGGSRVRKYSRALRNYSLSAQSLPS